MIEAHKENDMVLQVTQLGVFVFDDVLTQQIYCPKKDLTMLPSYHIIGGTDEPMYQPNTRNLSLYSEPKY